MNNPSSENNLRTPEQIETSLRVVQQVFRQYRPRLLDQAGTIAHTDKQDGSPVTAMDVEIERALQAALAIEAPDVPVYGEETGYGDDLPSVFWLVDPIDGTKSFIAGVPTFTSMAVLVQNAEAIASVIYNPSTDDMYIAQKDKGAYKNNVRLDIGAQPIPPTAICKEQFIGPLNKMLEPTGVTCGVAPSGGGYGFTMVADGQAAARFNLHSGGYVHDYAPGALLLHEAGAAIIPVLNDTYTYETSTFVVCHPALEDIVRANTALLRDLELHTAREK